MEPLYTDSSDPGFDPSKFKIAAAVVAAIVLTAVLVQLFSGPSWHEKCQTQVASALEGSGLEQLEDARIRYAYSSVKPFHDAGADFMDEKISAHCRIAEDVYDDE